jgi:hypothetical protein
MALDYAPILADAQQLIADTGRLTTFEILSATPADPAKPWSGPAAPAVANSSAAMATFVPAQGTDLGRMGISEQLLSRVEQVALVASDDTGFDYAAANSATDSGVRWRIDWVQTLQPGSTVLLYAMGMKR